MPIFFVEKIFMCYLRIMNINNLQSFWIKSSNNMCYAAVIAKVICSLNNLQHNLENTGKVLDTGIELGFIYYNKDDYNDPQNFFMLNPAALISCLTGKRYECVIEDRNYKAKKGEIVIDFYALSEENGKKGIGHFIYEDYDPILGSNTRKNGFIYSKRVFRRI